MKLLVKISPVLLLLVLFSCEKSSTIMYVGNWVQKSNFAGNGRSYASSFTIGNYGYVGLGYISNPANGKDRLNDFYSYYQDSDRWTQVDSFPGMPRSSAVGIGTSTKGYIIGGYSDNEFTANGNDTVLNDVWQFDPSQAPGQHPNRQWTYMGLFPGQARYGAIGFCINDICYFGTGMNADKSDLGDFWGYNPKSNTWTNLGNIEGSKRFYATAFVIQNKGYLVTGMNNGVNINDFWQYNPTTNTWIKKNYIANVQTATFDDLYTTIIREMSVSFVINGKGYVSTGLNGGMTNVTWEYDPVADLWTRKTDFEGSLREGANAFSFGNNTAYVFNGQSGMLSYDDVWQFFPFSEYNPMQLLEN